MVTKLGHLWAATTSSLHLRPCRSHGVHRVRAGKKQFLPTPLLLFSFITLCSTGSSCTQILFCCNKTFDKNREIPVVSAGRRLL